MLEQKQSFGFTTFVMGEDFYVPWAQMQKITLYKYLGKKDFIPFIQYDTNGCRRLLLICVPLHLHARQPSGFY